MEVEIVKIEENIAFGKVNACNGCSGCITNNSGCKLIEIENKNYKIGDIVVVEDKSFKSIFFLMLIPLVIIGISSFLIYLLNLKEIFYYGIIFLVIFYYAAIKIISRD